MHAQPYSGARCLDFLSDPSSTSILMCANSEGSDKTAQGSDKTVGLQGLA